MPGPKQRVSGFCLTYSSRLPTRVHKHHKRAGHPGDAACIVTVVLCLEAIVSPVSGDTTREVENV